MPDMEEYQMPNCRTDICTYDYAYPGKCYHCDDCAKCELHFGNNSCHCMNVKCNVINDVNYNCPYFESLYKEKDNGN